MGKVMEIQISGIKCDARGCGYHDDSVKFEQYNEYLNKPCPKCGANLLTQEALDNAKAYIRLAKMVNLLFGWMVKDDTKLDAVITPQYDENGKPAGAKVEKR